MSDLEQLNKTLRDINKSLRLIHKELVISNVPDDKKQVQREWFSLLACADESVRSRDMCEYLLDNLEKKLGKDNIEQNEQYKNYKKSYDSFEKQISELYDYLENRTITLSYDDVFKVGDNND